MPGDPALLEVRALSIDIVPERGQTVRILDDIALDLAAGETLGIVGESGSGKSMLALALIGLLPGPARATGQILFDGTPLIGLPEHRFCAIRGRRIGMVFQEPMTALNPAMSAGDQIGEGLRLHHGLSRAAARAETLRLLERVRIPEARRRIDAFPHELSGGQRQRVGIAIALAGRPALLIADEPTTALDVTVQADILDLFDELVTDLGMALIFISHDLGVIARIADRTLVMFGGRRMEEAPTETVLRRPATDYTRALIAALPRRARAGLDRMAP